ncbi:nitric oxide synthase, inducible-like [Hylaeus volcanicus]|uniref:nitric oxide synthase, inducible-like n=1 Tax=Hylaeus volcanicus TaxID=313075 RepID=UPI0023B881B8|nr:nitric oxide synthase, inducible-like [Hylaeus volcanicus]
MPEKLLDFEPENMIAKFYSSCYGFRIETSKELLQDSSKANTSSVKHITFNLTKMYDKFKIFECSDDMIENLVPESYCPWTYSAAQTVEVVTGNDSIEVDWWFQRVFKDSGLTMNDHLYFKPMSFVYKLSFPPNTTIGNILKYFCDFSSIASRDFLKNMLHFVQDDCEKQVLKQLLNDDDYVSFIFQPMLNLREVLTLFGTSARFTTTHDLNDILKFLSIIPRKRPRPYSISSAYALDQPSLSLTVAQFVSKTTDKRIKKLPSLLELQNEIEKKSGFVCRTKTTPQSLNVSQHSETRYFYGDVSSKLCSTNILNNEHVLMSLILTNPLKKMSLKFPILLIACGTGIAPCRSIWREIHSLYKTDSSHFGEHSKVVLLYGCTHPDVDLLYKEEIQDYWQTSDACASNRNKHLFSHAFFAFSRYDKKCYVQDLIIGDAACVIKSMSTFKQFFIYVCGSNAMGKGVNESLTHVLSKKNIRRMKKKKQYIEDLWG